MLNTIIAAFIAFLGTILTGVVIPYLKTKTTAQQRATVLELVSTAVTAAEQMFKGDGKGPKRKEYVKNWLSVRGIEVDDEVDALIESMVWALNN